MSLPLSPKNITSGLPKSKDKKFGPNGKNVQKKQVESAEKTSATTEVGVGASVCVEGMSAAELTMVKRLAGNDPIIRKKTLRKLKKWLNVLAQKVPDTPECRSMIEPNFIRVWKALFYCMWMADKPLPQEQLADQLSDLQIIFATKNYPFLLFVEWFIRTIAREWSWIDKFRIDKFMMLFRRFLRKSLLVIAQKKWHNDILEGYLKIISTHIFNRGPVLKRRKDQSFASPLEVNAPVGLQIHFVDIFMEEIAKVGGESMKFQKLLKILSIFIQELCYNSDDRLLDEIRERIFHHLMRQSDVGIDYQDQLAYGDMEMIDEEEVEGDELDLDTEDSNFLLEDYDNDEVFENDGPLDPRAGAVDVILPQLDVDYGKLYQKLVEHGGQKDVKLKNRRILYSLASQFKELTEGKYPLALPEDETTGSAIPRKEIDKAAKRLIQEESAPGEGKRRKTKKERKREAKRKLNANSTFESVGSEDDSQFIHDDELLDHVTDNYMSYLENEVESKSAAVAGLNRENEASDQGEDNLDGDNTVKSTKKGKTKNDKVKKRKWKTEVEIEADEIGDMPTSSNVQEKEVNVDSDSKQEEIILIKKPKLGKSKRNSLSLLESIHQTTPLKGKIRRLTELHTPKNKSSPANPSSAKSSSKRVSFVLARNKEHDHSDYPMSIARSPAIPFDKNKRPNCGLLKSPGNNTPKSTPIKRATALEFF